MTTYPELGFYALAGHVESPRDMLDELRLAEEIGLGSAFLSERLNVKEAASLSGAAVAVTERLGIVTAATNQTFRHPAVTAAWATTVHRLSGGRFSLGLGRGLPGMLEALGEEPVTTAKLEDFIGLMRRLWRGETVVDHRGPAGSWPALKLDPSFDESVPVGLVGMGPATLALAGRVADVVVLHPFLTDGTVRRCVERVRTAAEQADRDPGAVRVWSCLATVPDPVDEPARLRRVVARLATYLQMYGDLLVRTNDWDPALLRRFREDPVVAGLSGWADAVATPAQVEHLASILPPEWMDLAATGRAEDCAEAAVRQLALGADGVLLHGATPTQLAPVVAAYAAYSRSRPA
jgi:probable F420-dependent oxidoreductase